MKGRILTSLLTVIVLTGLQAQNVPAVPKLVVGLTIDQLRTDYIEAFSALYGERGFKRLWKEGRIYLNAEYDFINVDKSSSVAAIYSGTTPYTNGIVGDNWMDRATLRVINCVDDNNFMGIYTSTPFSCFIINPESTFGCMTGSQHCHFPGRSNGINFCYALCGHCQLI